MPVTRNVQLGKPSIAAPKQANAEQIAQAVSNTRERIEKIEQEVIYLGKLLEGSLGSEAILVLQRQIALLNTALNALVATVAAGSSDALSTELAFEAKMRAIAQSAAYLLPAPDAEHSFVLNRVFRA